MLFWSSLMNSFTLGCDHKALMVQLNLSAAFDCVSPEDLLWKLKDIRIDGLHYLMSWDSWDGTHTILMSMATCTRCTRPIKVVSCWSVVFSIYATHSAQCTTFCMAKWTVWPWSEISSPFSGAMRFMNWSTMIRYKSRWCEKWNMKVYSSKSRCLHVSGFCSVLSSHCDLLYEDFSVNQDWCIHNLGGLVWQKNLHLDVTCIMQAWYTKRDF